MPDSLALLVAANLVGLLVGFVYAWYSVRRSVGVAVVETLTQLGYDLGRGGGVHRTGSRRREARRLLMAPAGADHPAVRTLTARTRARERTRELPPTDPAYVYVPSVLDDFPDWRAAQRSALVRYVDRIPHTGKIEMVRYLGLGPPLEGRPKTLRQARVETLALLDGLVVGGVIFNLGSSRRASLISIDHDQRSCQRCQKRGRARSPVRRNAREQAVDASAVQD